LESVTLPGAVTVAVFVRVPLAFVASVPCNWNVTEPPGRMLTEPLMPPVPLAAGHVDPVVAVHVQETFVRDGGGVSVTVAPVTADGPALVAVI
jgi:hypothetical protein